MGSAPPPLPPRALRDHAGRTPPGEDAARFYVERGLGQRRRIEELLPAGWTWAGKRALDFGCGAGRTLRHLLPEAETAEMWGCDPHEASISWLEAHLSPPLRAFALGGAPCLPQGDGYFDAVWALSVFTHVHADWPDWLLELRRVLADDGYLIVTFLSDGLLPLWNEVSEGAPWDPDRVGTAVFRRDAPWEDGGPIVFLSEWWIRAHWGRAFEIERLETSGFGPGGQGFAVLRKRPGPLRAEDLVRPAAGEPREVSAAIAEADRLARELEYVYGTRSWRLTRPLRRLSGSRLS